MVEAIRQYTLPLLFALLLHALAVVSLQIGWEPDTKTVREIKPLMIRSKLIVMEAKPAPKARPKPPPPKPAAAKPEAARTQPQKQTQPKSAEPKPDPKAEQAAREAAERRAREAAAQQARLAEMEEQARQRAIAEEEQNFAAEASDADEVAVQTYQMGIYRKVVDNWSRPPSARNGMEARLLVELVPIGDVVAVTIVKSSGTSAFDQSAEAAVRKARRFEVPKESRLFEANFRRFELLFRPEDLLR